jgi:hypothetical protein
MTQTKKETMYAEIEKHGNNLNAIFHTELDPITLCKRLRSLEKKASQIAYDYCDGKIQTDEIDKFTTPIMDKVYKLLNNGKYNDDRPHQKKVPVFFNSDCRGYALKINDSYVRMLETAGKTIYRDWGGYGILAPDFTPNN